MAGELLLQIFHVSDLHIGDHRRPSPLWRWALSHTPVGGAGILHGLSSHDPAALIQFEKAVQRVLATFQGQDKSWIVCTGDLTTWGDNGSLLGGLNRLRNLAKRCGRLPCFSIYGNHDVWDDGFPLFSSLGSLNTRRSELRQVNRFTNGHFAMNWPIVDPVCQDTGRVLRAPIPGTSREIRFCSLNTIVHEPLRNAKASGEVQNDRYWEDLTVVLDHQLDRLNAELNGDDIRVVLTHHPIHHPKPPPVGMVLDGAKTVADALARPRGTGPLGSVVISGHTHKIFPDLNDLPVSIRRTQNLHAPLKDGQVQLIIGSLSQDNNWNGQSQEHSFELLRFIQDPPNSGKVFLERIIFTRSNASGEFQPLGSGGNFAEQIALV